MIEDHDRWVKIDKSTGLTYSIYDENGKLIASQLTSDQVREKLKESNYSEKEIEQEINGEYSTLFDLTFNDQVIATNVEYKNIRPLMEELNYTQVEIQSTLRTIDGILGN